MIRAGIRVIQNPDFRMKQNGEALKAGTIVYVPREWSSDDRVTVIWDNGQKRRCRAGKDEKYDLRVFDNAPVGICHKHVGCDSCDELPITGIRWKCSSCNDFDLCTLCYMAGKHDKTHSFLRMDVEDIEAVPVLPRYTTTPKDVQGVFEKAIVMQGPHWKWGDDDSGEKDEGTVLDIVSWQESSPRGGVNVKWTVTEKEGTYRLGGDGCVDVICTEDATAGTFYIEHLPLVDIINPREVILKNSDKVRVPLDKKNFERLQEHSQWDDGMIQCISQVGTVVKMLYGGKAARVQYSDGETWTVNRHALCWLHSFRPDDVISILKDETSVRRLQQGHGGWNDKMKSTLGSIGRIARIDTDGDIYVKVENDIWLYNPVCCCILDDHALATTAPQLTKAEVEQGVTGDLNMQANMELAARALADLLNDLLKSPPDDRGGEMSIFKAAAEGNTDLVKDIVRQNPEKVNTTHNHKTALQLACFEGDVEVVKSLLDNKADVNVIDEEGDSALHFAAFGQNDEAMRLLLYKGADVNLQNKKGQTSLHISIAKSSVRCTTRLIKHGASVNSKDENGNSSLHDCITRKEQHDLLDVVFNTLTADFTVVNGKGFNVLQWAALKDSRRAAEIMISKAPGMIDMKMAEGFTALHICAANDHVEIASLLLKAGATIDATDGNGRTPLIVAASQSYKRTVELLLTYHCKVDVKDGMGNTALHVAQISNILSSKFGQFSTLLLNEGMQRYDTSVQISGMLVEAGASITIKNNKGQTAIDMCRDKATKNFLKSLEEAASTQKLEKSDQGAILPAHWDRMESSVSMKRIPLDTANSMLEGEIQGVKRKFHETLPQANIITIERVQNKFLWEFFFFKRVQLESLYGKGCSNELDLYHGTEASKVDLICRSNIDNRLAGQRYGALYGQGSYFASKAKYSDSYASADKSGYKYMFQCRVLTGRWACGGVDFKRPPPIKDDDPSRLYDCCVDNIDRPAIFCLFDMNQYYPEYVIKYQ